ncbi:MAG: MSMEG_0565 family glycosyltransferase [Thermoplasmata archaeon]
MRVAMLTYSTRPRGGVVHALKLAERLSTLGAEITLYSLARSDDEAQLQGYFRPVSVPYKIFAYDWSSDLMTRLRTMIDAYVEGLPHDADVYHAQDCVGGPALAELKSRGLVVAPTFRTVHHLDDFAEPRLFDFEKRAVAKADQLFVVSKHWRDKLSQDYGVDSLITYNGLDAEDFSHLPPRTSTVPTVLFVGGLEPRKGLEFLIHAMEKVIEEFQEARLIAVGKTGFRGTDEWSWFMALADRLRIGEHMEFHESVPQETLLAFYSDCDLLAMPSRTEGWGLALMEAMACGKPVVASRAGGIPELVRDGVDGMLVPPGDVRGLADSIIKLLRDRSLRERMGRAGAERVKEFSWDNTARIVLKAYEDALQMH